MFSRANRFPRLANDAAEWSDGAHALSTVVRSRRLSSWTRWFNPTFLTFALVTALTALGLVGVYTSSAAIVAYRENLEARRREASAEETPTVSSLQGIDDRADFHEIFAVSAPPSFHSATYLLKQVVWAVMGLAALLIVYHIDYHFWRRWSPHLLAFTFCLLVGVWAPVIGRNINGANRWVGFGPLSVQPSELAKLAMVLFMARSLATHRARLHRFFQGFLPHVALLGLFCVVILKEPDLGATATLGLIVIVLFYAAGMRTTHLGLLIACAVPVLAIEFAVPYRRARLLAFLNPEEYFRTHAWQLNQSLIAIGSGGLTGTGLGAGPQKYQFLSTAFSDFVYAILCEEMGFIGGVAIALAFLGLFLLGWAIAWRAPDLVGMLTALGITCMFALSAFIHMFVNAGLMPTKGLTLPFISYGGSSLFINLTAAGILMNVARQGELYRAGTLTGHAQAEVREDAAAEAASFAARTLRLRSHGTTRDIPLTPDDLPTSPEQN